MCGPARPGTGGVCPPGHRPRPCRLWANPPFGRLEEVVAKASRESCLMLVVVFEWSGSGDPWWSAVCAICPKKWCFPDGRAVYLRGGLS